MKQFKLVIKRFDSNPVEALYTKNSIDPKKFGFMISDLLESDRVYSIDIVPITIKIIK